MRISLAMLKGSVLYSQTDLHFLICLITEQPSLLSSLVRMRVSQYEDTSPNLPTAIGNGNNKSLSIHVFKHASKEVCAIMQVCLHMFAGVQECRKDNTCKNLFTFDPVVYLAIICNSSPLLYVL